jgi:hypothetical protein
VAVVYVSGNWNAARAQLDERLLGDFGEGEASF